jgi:hypothetical protein
MGCGGSGTDTGSGGDSAESGQVQEKDVRFCLLQARNQSGRVSAARREFKAADGFQSFGNPQGKNRFIGEKGNPCHPTSASPITFDNGRGSWGLERVVFALGWVWVKKRLHQKQATSH